MGKDVEGASSRPARRHGRGVRRRVGGLSLPAAVLCSIAALLILAAVVLFLSGTPWVYRNEGWLRVEPLSWKERITYAGAVAAASGATVALVVNYRKQRDAEDGKFAAAFAEATAQMGNASSIVRLGGVYAMAALADRHQENQQQCIDALCGYLRLPYSGTTKDPTLVTETITQPATSDGAQVTLTHTYRPEDREVRLTIIRLIRDHLRDPDDVNTWCGRNFDFTGATFDGGDFSEAHFTEGMVSFERASFSREMVSFDRARFSGGTVSFDGAGGTIALTV